jgi:hypothetical protein
MLCRIIDDGGLKNDSKTETSNLPSNRYDILSGKKVAFLCPNTGLTLDEEGWCSDYLAHQRLMKKDKDDGQCYPLCRSKIGKSNF